VLTILLDGDGEHSAPEVAVVREGYSAEVSTTTAPKNWNAMEGTAPDDGDELFSSVDMRLSGLSVSLPSDLPDVHEDWETLGVPEFLGADMKTVEGTAAQLGIGSAAAEEEAPANDIVTQTPDGVQRLSSYLSKVEAQLTKEAMQREEGLAEMKSMIEQANEYNKAARKKLEKALQDKIEANAQHAKDSLQHAMKQASDALAQESKLSKGRSDMAADEREKLAAKMKENREEAEKKLKLATAAWSKSQAALAEATNAKIDQMNQHIAANAGQITANAQTAQKGLDHLMSDFTAKMAAQKAGTAKSIADLGAKMSAENKATRQFVQSKIGALVSLEASKFQHSREKMAVKRHELDLQLTHTAARLQACLNAMHALQDPEFSGTVQDIDKVKGSAQSLAAASLTEFKMAVAALGALVRQQTAELEVAKGEAEGSLPKGTLLGAKIARVADAELKRLIHLAGRKYTALKQDDPELHKLLQANKAATPEQLTTLALDFQHQLATVRENAARSTKPSQEKAVDAAFTLYSKLAEQHEATKNGGEESDDLKSARKDAEKDFHTRFTELSKVVASSTRYMSDHVAHMAGLNKKEARSSAQGRALLHTQNEANRADLKAALQDAVRAGERRGLKALKKAGRETGGHMQVCAALSDMVHHLYLEVLSVALDSDEARNSAQGELLASSRTAVGIATQNLEQAVHTAVSAPDAADAQVKTASDLSDAVGALHRALLVFSQLSAKPIASDNKDIAAHAKVLLSSAKTASEGLDSRVSSSLTEVATSLAQNGAGAEVVDKVKDVRRLLQAAVKDSDTRYTAPYKTMAATREKVEGGFFNDAVNLGRAEMLALALDEMQKKNDADQPSPESLEHAAQELARARKAFASTTVALLSSLRSVEVRLIGDAAVVTGEEVSHARSKVRVNRRVTTAMGRLVDLAMSRMTTPSPDEAPAAKALLSADLRSRAAGILADRAIKLKGVMDKLTTDLVTRVLPAARDVTEASKALYSRLAHTQHTASAGALLSGNSQEAMEEQRKLTEEHISSATADLQTELTMLTNLFVANAGDAKQLLREVAGLEADKPADQMDDTERTCLLQHAAALQADLGSVVLGAVMLGEAEAKQHDDQVRARLTLHHEEMQEVLSQRLERTVDKAFGAVPDARAAMVKNYLSLKAYVSAVGWGKLDDVLNSDTDQADGGFASLADLLLAINARSETLAADAVELGLGKSKLAPLFAGEAQSLPEVSAADAALVNEYASVVGDVRTRWRQGLGNYVLKKLEAAMQDHGVLMTRHSSATGQMVVLNGASLGLTGQMSGFKNMAVPVGRFSDKVQQLANQGATGGVAAHADLDKMKPVYHVPPPQWPGDVAAP